MTDNEIIKALECCTNHNALDNCDICPLCDYGNCQDTLIKYCSNTINRQKAEIERLEEESADKERAYNEAYFSCKELKEKIKLIKIETIRDFTEKVKTKI